MGKKYWSMDQSGKRGDSEKQDFGYILKAELRGSTEGLSGEV